MYEGFGKLVDENTEYLGQFAQENMCLSLPDHLHMESIMDLEY